MRKCNLLLATLLISLLSLTACNQANSKNSNDNKPNKRPDIVITKDAVTVEEARIIIKENEGNTSFVLLDVRTNAEYNEGHLKNAVQHDFYSQDFDTWLLSFDKEKRYLVYCRTQVRSKKAFDKLKKAGFKYIQYIEGGFTEWGNKRYEFEKPAYKKVLDVHVTADKIKTNSTINFAFTVTDLNDDPIRKCPLSLQLFLNNTLIESKTITMDDKGKSSFLFDGQSKAQGAYRLVCTATKENYESGVAYYYFDIATQDEMVAGSAEEIKKEADITEKMAVKFYNRNIYGYKAYDKTQKLISLGDLVNNEPALLLFISPSCATCMEKAKDLIEYDLEGIKLIPIITSVDADIAKGISKTEEQLKALGLESIIPIALYDSKDEIWFSRFKFATTPKFILINKEGQIKDIIHGSQTLKITTLIKRMEGLFALPPFIHKAGVLRQLAEFEKGVTVKIKDKETTLLSELNSLDVIKEKIDFPYPDYDLNLTDFAPNVATNSLKLTYYIEYKQARKYKSKTIKQDFYGFKKAGSDLEDEINEMNNILKDHGFFNITNIPNITLEDFSEEHIINECTSYGYKVVVKRIDKDVAKNEATLHYYIQKMTKQEVRTEDKTHLFYGFLILSENQKKVKEMLKEFEGVSVNDVDIHNTIKFTGKSFADVELTVYLTGEKKKVKDVLNGKPALIGIGYYGCPGCMYSWQAISQQQKQKQGFEVIELLAPVPREEKKQDFITYLETNGLNDLKNHFYNYLNVPLDLRLENITGVPAFMLLDKNGVIQPRPLNLNIAFKMLETLKNK